MKIESHTRTTHTLTTDGGAEVELTFEPSGDPLVHETPDTIVVGYLIQDSDCENPMASSDGSGVLHMLVDGRHRSYGEDNPEVTSALGLQSDGTPDIDATFNHGAGFDTLRGLATLALLAANPGLDLTDDGVFSEHEEGIDKAAVNLYAQHWQAIAGPFVVPVASYNDGRVGVTTWDGDTDDLPEGVWVADEDVQANLVAYPPGVEVGQINGEDGKLVSYYELTEDGVRVFAGLWSDCQAWVKSNYTITAADTDRAVAKYAEGVLKEYSAWAEGECYGLTVEIFEREGDDWVEAEGSRENECWNFVGRDYAEETLRTEFFVPAVAALST